ncbi:MAG TPA: inositol monophosphatase family protein [Thermoanaerobaculia bacterium]|nr:inositol monophosphatase family protein [Thermoanaerobaculia bacterium]
MIETAREAARRGGEVLLSWWRRLPPGAVEEKAQNDFVSRADRESEAVIVETLLSRHPGDGVVGEEGTSRRGTTGREWIIDPLDGTSNFIAGFPFWCVSIAAREKGTLVAGVVWDPLRGEMYAAERGAGAWRNGERIAVSRRASAAGAYLATGFPFRAHERIDPYLAIFRSLFLQAKAIRRAGSAALDLANVAAGVFDGFFEFHLSPWDIAAGAVLIAEAGGVLRDFGGGERYLETGDVVAGSTGVVTSILGVVGDVLGR